MPSEQPFPDHISLLGDEASVYEAIATLEYVGRPVDAADLVASTNLDDAVVRDSLKSLTKRGFLIEHVEDAHVFYEPAHRGWSAAPEQGPGWRE